MYRWQNLVTSMVSNFLINQVDERRGYITHKIYNIIIVLSLIVTSMEYQDPEFEEASCF